MSDKELNFEVGSGLKDILGKDLISDDFIAVFELVKNSFDAHAEEVTITFTKNTLTISDNGKGMSFSDIEKKWLRVAYSAKKQGEEDEDLKGKEFADYRGKIQPVVYYAGAKGIGRFSCDRLGAILLLTTKKAGMRSVLEQIQTDWGRFESDPDKKFESVKVKYKDPPDASRLKGFKHGTVLEISALRSNWDREKIISLKHSLEKLINPFEVLDENASNLTQSKSRKFKITFIAEAEKKADSKQLDPRKKVNGEIHNFVFETLKLKTTQILTQISVDGSKVTTQLVDRGKVIYKIEEPNNSEKLLSNIKFHLFYLNHAAKLNFKKLMGITSVEFGSVFLYKNGFRVYPFGEEGEDSFGIDRRKQQGYARYLGTREVIGRIEIYGNDEQFKETTSRDGGLIRNRSYIELEKCFFDKCLRRLENYVVNIQWKLGDRGDDISIIKNNVGASANIAGIISRLVEGRNVRLLSYAKDFLNIVNEKLTADDVLRDEVFDDLEKIARKVNDTPFQSKVRSAKRKYTKLLREKEEAIEHARKIEEERQKAIVDRRKAEEKRRKAEEALERERKKNLFFNATGKNNNQATLGLIHHIKLTSKALNSRIRILTKDIANDKFDPAKGLEILSEIKVYSEKIQKLSEIVTYSDLNFKYAKHKGDIVKFVEEYINEIRSGLPEITLVVNSNSLAFETEFSILELSIILDNLISNAENSLKSIERNKRIQIDFKKKTNGIKMQFSDNGLGVDANVEDHIFDLGFTTTRGSGIGLHTSRDLMRQSGGELKFIGNKNVLKGATFELTF